MCITSCRDELTARKNDFRFSIACTFASTASRIKRPLWMCLRDRPRSSVPGNFFRMGKLGLPGFWKSIALAVELFPYSEGGRGGAGGTVLPRRHTRGSLDVACFTRNRSKLASGICRARPHSGVVNSAERPYVRVPYCGLSEIAS